MRYFPNAWCPWGLGLPLSEKLAGPPLIFTSGMTEKKFHVVCFDFTCDIQIVMEITCTHVQSDPVCLQLCSCLTLFRSRP